MFNFVRSCHTLPKELCYFMFPPAVEESSVSFISLLIHDIVILFNFSHPSEYVVIS